MSYECKYVSDPDEIEKLLGYRLSDEYQTVLAIYVNGKFDNYYIDRGEPEDNSFGRDWMWVKDELEKAYKLGCSKKRNGT